jgi:hypothetical protein
MRAKISNENTFLHASCRNGNSINLCVIEGNSEKICLNWLGNFTSNAGARSQMVAWEMRIKIKSRHFPLISKSICSSISFVPLVIEFTMHIFAHIQRFSSIAAIPRRYNLLLVKICVCVFSNSLWHWICVAAWCYFIKEICIVLSESVKVLVK